MAPEAYNVLKFVKDMKMFQQWLKSSTASAVLLLLLLHSFAISAQVVRDRVYGTANGNEELGTMIPLRLGGYLMVGSSYISTRPSISSKLYLLRLNANGDTLWTKRQAVPGCFIFYPQGATEDANGRVLISGQSYTSSGTSRGDAFLVMLNPRGDTLWTKRTASIADDFYYKAQLLTNGDFLVSAELNNGPVLMRLTATGQVVWQRTLAYAPSDPGFAGQIIPMAGVAGQYWVPLGATNPPYSYKFMRCDSNGLTGIDIPAPLGVYHSDIMSDGLGYIIAADDGIKRLDAAFNILWLRTPTARGLQPLFKKIVPTPDGNFLVGGEAYTTGGGIVPTLNKISPTGIGLKDTVFFRSGQVFLKGLAIDPMSGDYVFAGYASNGPIGQADVYWTQWRRSLITANRTAQLPGMAWSAYPNPLSGNALMLQAEQPLRGILHLRDALGRHLGSWPAAGQSSQTLPLPNLPAGVYLLSLESPEATPRILRLVKP